MNRRESEVIKKIASVLAFPIAFFNGDEMTSRRDNASFRGMAINEPDYGLSHASGAVAFCWMIGLVTTTGVLSLTFSIFSTKIPRLPPFY